LEIRVSNLFQTDPQALVVRKGDTLTSCWTLPTSARTYPIDPPFVAPASGYVYLAINDDGATARVEKFVTFEPTEGTE
jgi:hypothetical protein